MRVWWFLALCGCDGILHLQKVPQPAGDAALDTPGAPFCMDKKSALLCADFEGPFPPPFFSGNAVYNLTTPPAGVTRQSTSSPDGVGLALDTTGSAYSIDVTTTAAMTATKIDIELVMRFDRVDTFTGEIPLVSLGVSHNNAGFGSCDVQLQLVDPPRRFTMQDYCGTNAYPDVFTTFPAGWNKIGLVLDLAHEQAITYVNGSTVAMLDLGVGLSSGTAPYVHVGFDGPGDAGISLDDVVAVVTP